MPFPFIFATQPTGNVPASDLDANFAAAFLLSGTNTVTGTTTLSPSSGDALNVTVGALNTTVATIASAATVSLGTSLSNYVIITGNTTITSFGTSVQAGAWRIVKFSSNPTLTNSASLLCPGGVNLTTTAGGVAFLVDEGSNIWRVAIYTPNTAGGGGATAGSNFLSVSTASNQATLAITANINATYDEYEIRYNTLVPVSGSSGGIKMQVSTDGGTTWKTSGYDWIAAQIITPATPAVNAVGTQNDIAIMLNNGINSSTTAHLGASGVIKFVKPAGTDRTAFNYDVMHVDSSGAIGRFSGVGWWTTAGTINAVRFLYATGNISTGTFYLYGKVI